MPPTLIIAMHLATAFLAGDWTEDKLVERGGLACGHRGRWLRFLVRRMMAAVESQALPATARDLYRFIHADRRFQVAHLKHHLGNRHYFSDPPPMRPTAGPPMLWSLPAMVTAGRLADWLGIGCGELDWFADCQGREAKQPLGPLRHYNYHWLAKASGKSRLLEAPKARLKAIQRRLLDDMLALIPVHEAVHGFRRGRSIVSYAAPHVGQRFVMRLDLRNFFPSVGLGRVRAIFRTAGYPETVVKVLAGLCTNVVPLDVLEQAGWKGERQFDRSLFVLPHLPQGAPTSPALANLAAYRLDCRLTALAEKLGTRYTRYADDLAFSGGSELERGARRFQVQVGCIALDEGFAINHRKTRFMRQAVRQQLAGIVVNVHANTNRASYDDLKAILHNCARHGPQTQNRSGHPEFRAHLLGRIAYLEQINPARSRRLRKLFDQIHWE